MTLSTVEHALGMMRVYLVECATQNEWGDDRHEDLARAILACARQTAEEAARKPPERDSRLARDVLRRAVRFVNDNLDSKLRWNEIAAIVDLDPFTFGRGFKLATGMTPHQYIIRCRLAASDAPACARGAVARRYRSRSRLFVPEPFDDLVSQASRDHTGRISSVREKPPATGVPTYDRGGGQDRPRRGDASAAPRLRSGACPSVMAAAGGCPEEREATEPRASIRSIDFKYVYAEYADVARTLPVSGAKCVSPPSAPAGRRGRRADPVAAANDAASS